MIQFVMASRESNILVKGVKPRLVRVCMLVVFLLSVMAGSVILDGSSPLLVEAKAKSFVYNPKVPLPQKQQSYLYQLCKKRGLDYKETLAVIKQESNFRPYAKNGKSYGLFQIHKVNHAYLAKKLKTPNKPLDPYVNMNWGTYMLSDLTKKFYKKGYRNVKLKEAVLSAYNKGEYGYKKTGKAVAYIKSHNRALAIIKSWFS